MRLKISEAVRGRHEGAVTSVVFAGNSFLSAGDEGGVGQWSPDGEYRGQLTKTDDYGITDMHYSPVSADVLAVAGSDGKLRFMTKGGKEENVKQASAEGAAVISVRWSYDGSALATGGEDGSVKIWSKTGMLRTTLATAPRPVYVVRWGADNSSLMYASGRDLTIVSVGQEAATGAASSGKSKSLTWKAHEGVVLTADWSPITGRIVSGGEDCRYRVWDSVGRQIFMCAPLSHVVTAVAWAPNGEHFAVGSFNTLRLCDKTGWSHSREAVSGGSLQTLAWAADGTLVAAGGGSGAVAFAQLTHRREFWGDVEAIMTEPTHITITDTSAGAAAAASSSTSSSSADREELEFRDRIVEFSLGFGHLVVTTAAQCHIYTQGAWHAPHVFDIRAPVLLIVQSARYFLTVDAVTGVTVYTYEGRAVCNPKYPGLRPELLSRSNVALSNDCVAILDRTDGKTVRTFDLRNARQLGAAPYVHSTSVLQIALSQGPLGGLQERKLALLDASHDLYLTTLIRPNPLKLQTMVDSMAWGDTCDALVVLADSNMLTWLYPQAVFLDADLAAACKISNEALASSFGLLPQILSFTGSRIAVRRGDGAVLHAAVATYPPMLYDCVQAGKWEAAVRLCRFVKQQPLWAAAAAMAINGRHLDTAEVALAACGYVDKLQFILHVKEQATAEMRNAELAVFRGNMDEAETILLQAAPPMLYRAVKLNIRAGRWLRALELAQQHGAHVDTVVAYRQRYLQDMRRTETLEPLRRAAASVGPVDWPAIKARKDAEKAREASRGGAGGARSSSAGRARAAEQKGDDDAE